MRFTVIVVLSVSVLALPVFERNLEQLVTPALQDANSENFELIGLGVDQVDFDNESDSSDSDHISVNSDANYGEDERQIGDESFDAIESEEEQDVFVTEYLDDILEYGEIYENVFNVDSNDYVVLDSDGEPLITCVVSGSDADGELSDEHDDVGMLDVIPKGTVETLLERIVEDEAQKVHDELQVEQTQDEQGVSPDLQVEEEQEELSQNEQTRELQEEQSQDELQDKQQDQPQVKPTHDLQDSHHLKSQIVNENLSNSFHKIAQLDIKTAFENISKECINSIKNDFESLENISRESIESMKKEFENADHDLNEFGNEFKDKTLEILQKIEDSFRNLHQECSIQEIDKAFGLVKKTFESIPEECSHSFGLVKNEIDNFFKGIF